MPLANLVDITATIAEPEEISVTIEGGVTNFLALTDTPSSYLGESGSFLKVKSTEDGLEFTTATSAVAWGDITGTLSNQTDLQTALDLKTDETDFTSHTGDTTIHFTQGSISIPASQISDFDTEVSNNSSVSANTAKETNVTTNLSLGTIDSTTMVVASSDGTDATLISADTNDAGLLTAAKWDEIVANTSKVTNATHTGDVTGATALTIGADKVNDTHIDFGTGANQVSTADVPEQTNLYYTEGRVSANTDVSANTTHRSSDGTDHSNVVDNTLSRTENTEPNGFVDPSDVNVTFTNGTRTLEISPAVSTFRYYSDGIGYTKSSSEDIIIPDTEGIHFIYYDGTTLSQTTTFNETIIVSKAFVAAIYWDATNNLQLYFGREFNHTTKMGGKSHAYSHNTVGYALQSGGSLGDFITDAAGNLDSHAEFSNASTVAWDEDAQFSLSARTSTTNIPVLYRSGVDESGIWRIDESASFPVLTTGTGRAAWNELTGGSWQQTEVTDGDFVLAHVLATNDTDRPFVIFQGQNEYADISSARDGAETEVNDLILSGLPILEFKFLGTIIMQTDDTYSNTVKSRTRTTNDGSDYIDLRGSAITRSGVSGTVTSHNDLAGLQGGVATEFYHLTNSQESGLTSSADTTLHFHDSDRARANHTGTQTASTISDFDTEVSNNTDVSANTTYRGVGHLPLCGGTMSGNINLDSNKITNLTTPTDLTDAANKDYVDSNSQGLNWQESVIDEVNFVTSEPTGQSTGDRYINTATGTSNETSQAVVDTYIYEWNGSTWTETVPSEGFALWVEDEDVLKVFNGSAWVSFGSTITHNNLSGLQGGTTNEFFHLTSSQHTDLNAAVSGSNLTGTLQTATQANITTLANLVTVGALGSGSITSGFGNIDVGSSSIDAGIITADTNFAGDLTGNVTGNCSGSSGSTTGNSATATALETARTIGGVSFNGTANITVASATGGFAITGGDLTLGSNDITGVGSLGATGARLTKGWFTDLEVTNAIAGSITGNAATVSTITGLAPDTATTQATQANITTCSNLVTIGTLNSGSITSGFGNIDNGSSTLDTGALNATTGTFTSTITSESSIQGTELRELDTFTAGESVISGDLVFFKSDGKFWKVDADAEATSKGLLALAQETISADASGLFLLKGKHTTSGLTTADELYISTTAGEWTNTKPSATGDIVRLIGYSVSTTVLYFDPDKTYIEVA